MLRLVVVWLHLVAGATWVGGLLYASHLVAPAIARGARDALPLLTRGRIVSWAALAILIATGLENVRQMAFVSPWLAAKLVVVIAMLALAAHRDFAVLPRATRAVDEGAEPAGALSAVRALDRIVLLLALVVLFLAVGVARGR
ncbi:MAG TPA: CopD family protein [Methylomirabilota bacterium]